MRICAITIKDNVHTNPDIFETAYLESSFKTMRFGVRIHCFRVREGQRGYEFAEWHVAWPAEWHNYAECNIWKMAQRNKLTEKHARVSAAPIFGANLKEQPLCRPVYYCWLKPITQSSTLECMRIMEEISSSSGKLYSCLLHFSRLNTVNESDHIWD